MSKRIKFDLVGGVGNQLFTYCAGYYLSKIRSNRFEPRLQAPTYKDTKHSSSINLLKIDPEVSNQNLLVSTVSRLVIRIQSLLQSKFPSTARIWKSNSFRSTVIGFDPSLEQAHASRYFGYFQTYRYVSEIRKSEPNFLPAEPRNPSDWYLETKTRLSESNSIGLHIRGGDYLKQINHKIGVLSPKYFETALSVLIQELPTENPQIYIFTDDLNYAEKVVSEFAFRFNFNFIVPPDYVNATESLLLLSHTKACVISNSTFSWWGGFLNNPEKLVVAPKKWFKDMEDPTDLIPPHWILCESFWEDSSQTIIKVNQ